MNRQEIIGRLVFGGVPNAKLVEHVDPQTEVAVSVHTGNMGGMEVVIAREVASYLMEATVGLGDTPSSRLFVMLHTAMTRFDLDRMDASFIQAVTDKVKKRHREAVERLRQIAKEVNVAYTEPPDVLLS